MGRAVAYAHSTLTGHVSDDPDDIEQLRQIYDSLRDASLTPAQTIGYLHPLRATTS